MRGGGSNKKKERDGDRAFVFQRREENEKESSIEEKKKNCRGEAAFGLLVDTRCNANCKYRPGLNILNSRGVLFNNSFGKRHRFEHL